MQRSDLAHYLWLDLTSVKRKNIRDSGPIPSTGVAAFLLCTLELLVLWLISFHSWPH